MNNHNPEEIEIRQAIEADAQVIADLLEELGYPSKPANVLDRLRSLDRTGDLALVAVIDTQVVGLILLHRTPFLHRPPDGRISTLVVAQTHRGNGIGSLLVKEAEKIFCQWGCGRIELTSGAQRDAAHRFYERLGYVEKPKRFIKIVVN